MNLAENIKRKSVESEMDIFDAEFGENIQYEKKLIEELLTKAAENGEFECIVNVADMHHIVYQVVYKWLKNEGFTVNTHKPYSSDDLKDLVVALEVKWVNPTKSKEESKKDEGLSATSIATGLVYRNDSPWQNTGTAKFVNTVDDYVTLCSSTDSMNTSAASAANTLGLASSMSEKSVSAAYTFSPDAL